MDAGVVVICDNVTSVPSGYPVMMQRLGVTLPDYEQLEDEIRSAGFGGVVFKQDVKVRRDLSSPSDDIVKFIQLITGRHEAHVRAVIQQVFSQPDMHVSLRKLAIFSK